MQRWLVPPFQRSEKLSLPLHPLHWWTGHIITRMSPCPLQPLQRMEDGGGAQVCVWRGSGQSGRKEGRGTQSRIGVPSYAKDVPTGSEGFTRSRAWGIVTSRPGWKEIRRGEGTRCQWTRHPGEYELVLLWPQRRAETSSVCLTEVTEL